MRVQFGLLEINFVLITKQGILRREITRRINVQGVAIKRIFMWSLNANLAFMQIQHKFQFCYYIYSLFIYFALNKREIMMADGFQKRPPPLD